MSTRRTFLKTGLLGGALLTAGGLAAVLIGRDPTADRRSVLGAVIPAILEGALPQPGQERERAVHRCLEGVEAAIAGLAPAVQQEVAQLFALLAIQPTRVLLAGVRSGWGAASPDEVAAFLERWRGHDTGLMRSGYQALHDLVLGAWYADESTWAAIGYPGPLKL